MFMERRFLLTLKVMRTQAFFCQICHRAGVIGRNQRVRGFVGQSRVNHLAKLLKVISYFSISTPASLSLGKIELVPNGSDYTRTRGEVWQLLTQLGGKVPSIIPRFRPLLSLLEKKGKGKGLSSTAVHNIAPPFYQSILQSSLILYIENINKSPSPESATQITSRLYKRMIEALGSCQARSEDQHRGLALQHRIEGFIILWQADSCANPCRRPHSKPSAPSFTSSALLLCFFNRNHKPRSLRYCIIQEHNLQHQPSKTTKRNPTNQVVPHTHKTVFRTQPSPSQAAITAHQSIFQLFKKMQPSAANISNQPNSEAMQHQ